MSFDPYEKFMESISVAEYAALSTPPSESVMLDIMLALGSKRLRAGTELEAHEESGQLRNALLWNMPAGADEIFRKNFLKKQWSAHWQIVCQRIQKCVIKRLGVN